MTFWREVLSSFLASVLAGLFFVLMYVVIQWFLLATDLFISYSWSFEGTLDDPRNIRTFFNIRNRSRSRTYRLANIAYLKDKKPVLPFDNKSLWDLELRPGTVLNNVRTAPIESLTSLNDVKDVDVEVRLQNGRSLWLTGQGFGAKPWGLLQRTMFRMRSFIEKWAIPTE